MCFNMNPSYLAHYMCVCEKCPCTFAWSGEGYELQTLALCTLDILIVPCKNVVFSNGHVLWLVTLKLRCYRLYL
jgi:hypothetical protein